MNLDEIAKDLSEVWSELAQERQRHEQQMKQITQKLNMVQARLSAYAAISKREVMP